jgi:hypothetical protein
MLRYYLGVDPGQLSDIEWVMHFKVLEDIRKKEAGKK